MSDDHPSLLRLVGRPIGRLAVDRRLLWAVARNTIRQAIRVRAAFVIMALYLLLIPVLPFVLEGDGTLAGLLKLVIRYALILAGVLLGLLTLTLATTTLWSEIHEKQIYLLESRPVRRWHVVMGKLLGILVVNAALLVFMAVVLVGCVEFVARQDRWTDHQREIARRQVLTARQAVKPEPIPEHLLREQVDRHYRDLEQAGRLPAGHSEAEIKEALRQRIIDMSKAAPPRVPRAWQFQGVPRPRGPKAQLTIRFRYASSDRASVSQVRTRWYAGRPGTRHFYGPYHYDRTPDEFHEIQIPADAVSEEGELEVRFVNVEPTLPTLIFAGEEAIQVLVPAASFVGNLARGLVLIFVEILFLTILGLFCSTFLTFPVSPIIALALLLLIVLAGTVKAEFEQGFSVAASPAKETQVTRILDRVFEAISTGVRILLPPLDRYAASEWVSTGNVVPWSRILEAVGLVALLRGGALLLLGLAIFERRELALAER
jgi:ABC-type transport system involved in multi-copper enzyme maturation permease subunit